MSSKVAVLFVGAAAVLIAQNAKLARLWSNRLFGLLLAVGMAAGVASAGGGLVLVARQEPLGG
jgi:hypothetical protein